METILQIEDIQTYNQTWCCLMYQNSKTTVHLWPHYYSVQWISVFPDHLFDLFDLLIISCVHICQYLVSFIVLIGGYTLPIISFGGVKGAGFIQKLLKTILPGSCSLSLLASLLCNLCLGLTGAINWAMKRHYLTANGRWRKALQKTSPTIMSNNPLLQRTN